MKKIVLIFIFQFMLVPLLVGCNPTSIEDNQTIVDVNSNTINNDLSLNFHVIKTTEKSFFSKLDNERLQKLGKTVDDFHNGDHIVKGPFIACVIPFEIMCFDELYSKTDNFNTIKSIEMIGYLVRKNDLNFWIEKDNDSDIIYAVDLNSWVYRATFDLNLENRFELYLINGDYNYIAIKSDLNTLWVFEKKGRN